ncbi:hypothetical protein IF2G_00429 [Cordyceps javanica]|nr:hypothetical protein IF2G_00429 [Cordyceps javanica]
MSPYRRLCEKTCPGYSISAHNHFVRVPLESTLSNPAETALYTKHGHTEGTTARH